MPTILDLGTCPVVPVVPLLMHEVGLWPGAEKSLGLDPLTCPGSHQHIQAIEDICRVVQDQPQYHVFRLQLIETGPKQAREGVRMSGAWLEADASSGLNTAAFVLVSGRPARFVPQRYHPRL